MKRREFISLVVGAAAWTLPARAQQGAMPVIGLLSSRSPEVDTPLIAVIRRGLNETGVVEGQNVTFDYRWAEGQYDRLAGLAADLVRQQVAVIVTMGGEPSALAAKAATATIPIVFEMGGDPIQLGLAGSLSRPSGNATGVTQLNVEIVPKRLELLHELLPAARLIALLINPAESGIAETTAREVLAAARAFGLEVHVLNASSDRDFDSAFANS